MLGRVESFSAGLRDAVLAPEPVFLRTILRIGVGDHVSATAAPKDHDSSYLVVRQISLVDRDVCVAKFYDQIAGLAVVYCV